MREEVTLRRATPDDVDAVVDVWLRSFAAALPTVRRAHDDDEVEHQRPGADIDQVVVDPLPHAVEVRCLAAAAVDLRPARDPGLDDMPLRIVRQRAGVLQMMRDGVRPRSDQRHAAEQDLRPEHKAYQPTAPGHPGIKDRSDDQARHHDSGPTEQEKAGATHGHLIFSAASGTSATFARRDSCSARI